MSKNGLLIVVSGPAGCGKGTVLRELFNCRKGLYYSVSATTRRPRPDEKDGVNYFFLTTSEFEERIKSGKMLEYAMYCENYYGTPRDKVDEMLQKGQDVILEIEVVGAMNIKILYPDALLIFIMPPSLQELEARLVGRGTEDSDTIAKRIKAAETEMAQAHKYDYKVINNIAVEAAKELSKIIDVEKTKRI